MEPKKPVILEERRKTHGDYDKFAELEQNLQVAFAHFKTTPLTPRQCSAVNMILHKLARIGTGDPNFEDHWDDIAGYAMRGKGE